MVWEGLDRRWGRGSREEWKDSRQIIQNMVPDWVWGEGERNGVKTVSPARWFPVGALGLPCFPALTRETGTGTAATSALSKNLSNETMTPN